MKNIKKSIFFSGVIMLSGITLYSFYASAESISETPAAHSAIHLQFQNNSWLPGKFTLKIKSAEDKAYGVISFRLFSFGKYKSDFTAGSSIYLINEEEQEVLMQGGEASGKLLIQIKPTDEGKTVKLIP